MNQVACCALAAWLGCWCFSGASAGDDPFADALCSFNAGANPAPGYDNPLNALGAPTRYTGVFFGYPTVVSAFSPPFDPGDIISIGAGGHLTVCFDTPITDDPNNPYGIDLIIFGNSGFIDAAYPAGVVAGAFGNDGGVIEVSIDGREWTTVKSITADDLLPTIGYMDAGPYDSEPGLLLTDFVRPADPSLRLRHFMGLNNQEVVSLYGGSGGGVGVDLGSAGVREASRVRVSVPAGSAKNIEIDAFSDVAPRLPGDANLDGLVNFDDILLVIMMWGVPAPGDPPADLTNDGLVNFDDVLEVILHWST